MQPADNNGYRARFTVRPPGHGKREIYRKTTRRTGKKERFTADKPTDGKRERFTVGPPDHEKRERFAVGPPDKRSNAENALKQQLFLIPLSVSSVVGFGARGGVVYMGERSENE